MQKSLRHPRPLISLLLLIFIAVGALAGLYAAFKRAGVEARNKTVELALEYEEVARLAQVCQRPLGEVIAEFQSQGVSSLIVSEDLLATLDQNGQARVTRVSQPDGSYYTLVHLDTPATLQRVRDALNVRGIAIAPFASAIPAPSGGTVFDAPPPAVAVAKEPAAPGPNALRVSYEYLNLRSLGLGLAPDSVKRVKAARMQIVGRVGNFGGVTPETARRVLQRLRATGAKMVIFNGDEVLGYRGLEKQVAAMLRDSNEAVQEKSAEPSAAAPNNPGADAPQELPLPVGMLYGVVEFGKQKGDETLAVALKGDYARVHAIQSAEIGQLEPREIENRFVLAARERNIRFCYIRLLTTASMNTPDDNPLRNNVDFVKHIAQGIEHGHALTGGDFRFGTALRYEETGGRNTMRLLFALMGLGAAGGATWLLRELLPLPIRAQRLALIGLSVVCVLLAFAGGEMGRKLVALLAGIAFPAVACLRTFPRSTTANGDGLGVETPLACLMNAIRAIGLASVITALGILHVVGLLATRPFMLRANQFLGIKAQHAVPILLVAFVALIGGICAPGETLTAWKGRVRTHLLAAYAEPARFGLLALGMVALFAFMVIVARTGNDSGVGASGFEMKTRAILDHFLPVRPRTKEFLVGHPAFILALAWQCRGRRALALPAFVVGSVGQVSLLNTFCHIHTPLIVSLWRDGLGLLIGIGLGGLLFLAGERVLPKAQAPAWSEAPTAPAENVGANE